MEDVKVWKILFYKELLSIFLYGVFIDIMIIVYCIFVFLDFVELIVFYGGNFRLCIFGVVYICLVV